MHNHSLSTIRFALVLAVCASEFAFHEARGQDTPANQPQRVQRNVAYAVHEGHAQRLTSLDVYAPAAGKNRPVMVWVHGGGWKIGDKRGVQLKPEAFNRRGFVFVSINYRLAPKATYKDQAGDVAAALRWVREHAAEYGASPERVYLMGHSAGAHLAALVAVDGRYLAAEKLPLSTIKGVVLLDGAGYDVARQIESAPLARSRELYKSVFGEEAEAQRDASPIAHIRSEQRIAPFLILHVAHRRDSKAQSEALAEKLKQAGGEARVISAAGKTHATINRELGKEDDAPTKAVFEFLEGIERKARAEND